MLLSLIIIVALIGAAVIGTIYSNFLVFYSNFAETENYHKAYYASIAALERAELVTKQRQPGYEKNGGRDIWNGNIVSIGRGGSDGPIEAGFSYLSQDSHRDSSSYREIRSLTSRIPSNGNGDVDRMLSANDSMNYNMMDYNNSEVFLLYKDPGSADNVLNDSPYKRLGKQGMIKCDVQNINGEIRLPSYLTGRFQNLDVSQGLLGTTADTETNDVIVDRQVSGKYNNDNNGSTQPQPFTIFATQSTTNGNVNTNEDSAIRESDLNENNRAGYQFRFEGTKDPKVGRNNSNWTLISPSANVINQENFSTILYNNSEISSEISQTQIRFSLLNHLKTVNGNIYPFLEYFINFNGVQVPDKYYTITSDGIFGDYRVKLTIIKPTIKRSILKSFTTMF